MRFTKSLGVNNQLVPGINVVYSDASSRVRALHAQVLNTDRSSHRGACDPCGRVLGLRPSNKSALCSDLVHQVRNMRHSGARVPKKKGLPR
jgi:hypothetical protein